jgi:very-short-patch-repair endonuclease
MTEGFMPRPKQPRDVYLARHLRSESSLPEAQLWRLLRNNPDGVKIRRQHPVGAFVLDFYCPAARVAFEIDGIVHDMGDRPARDEARDTALADLGIEVIRIPASDVLRSPEAVAEAIVRYCKKR